VTCRYSVPKPLATSIASASLEDVFERALALTILEHPLLLVGLVGADSKQPSWARLGQIDFRNHLKWQIVDESEDYDKCLLRVLEEHHDTPFTKLESQPQWRLFILKSPNTDFIEVGFVWSHTVGDGMSGKIFHETLLAKLHVASTKTSMPALQDHILRLPATSNFTPAVEELLQFPVSFGFVVSEAWHSLRPPSTVYSVTWAPIQITPCKTRLSLITVGNEALQYLLRECRKYKTTLTGLVHARALVSMATRIPKDQAPAFQIGTPVDIRRHMNSIPPQYSYLNPDQTIGNFVSYWRYKFSEDSVAKLRQEIASLKTGVDSSAAIESTVWSTATAIRQGLSKRIESGTKNDGLGMTKFVSDWKSYMQNRFKTPRTISWEISNLGVIKSTTGEEDLKHDTQERWTIGRALFTQSASVGGQAIGLNVVATEGKDLTIVFNWQSGVVDDSLVEGLAGDLGIRLNTVESGKASA
jgi:NRPS condensation-like uncharacterized protein